MKPNPRFTAFLRMCAIATLAVAFTACEAEKQQKPKVEAAAATVLHAAAGH